MLVPLAKGGSLEHFVKQRKGKLLKPALRGHRKDDGFLAVFINLEPLSLSELVKLGLDMARGTRCPPPPPSRCVSIGLRFFDSTALYVRCCHAGLAHLHDNGYLHNDVAAR